ncbi:MAG: TetR/AcrR family transcriptional regulator, partial [Bacteroidota bacterium]
MRDTKTDILNLAEQLIRTHGYNGFSYKDISSALHIKNAAVHYHYPAKSDLGVAVLRRMRTEFAHLKSTSQPLSAREKLTHFISIYTRSRNKGLVCIMGSLSPFAT